MRTLKQITTRINQLATSHQLINQVGFGSKEDLDNLIKKGLVYPFCFIENKPNIAISRVDKLQRFNFSIYFFDLQDVREDTRNNVLEVKSDLVSIATDVLALLQRDVDVDENQDWLVSDSTSIDIKEYQLSDLCIGVEVPIQIGLRYAADRCQVPTDTIPDLTSDMKIITNFKYRAVADTDSIILPLLKKEIVFLTKGNLPLQQVNNSPSVDEFTYNANTGEFVFGTPLFTDVILQILNRPL